MKLSQIPGYEQRLDMLAPAFEAEARRRSDVSGLRLLPAAYCSACADRWTPCDAHSGPELAPGPDADVDDAVVAAALRGGR